MVGGPLAPGIRLSSGSSQAQSHGSGLSVGGTKPGVARWRKWRVNGLEICITRGTCDEQGQLMSPSPRCWRTETDQKRDGGGAGKGKGLAWDCAPSLDSIQFILWRSWLLRQ